MQRQAENPPGSQNRASGLAVIALSTLFILLGLAATLYFFWVVGQDEALSQAFNLDRGIAAGLFVFLERFGLVIPLLVLGLSSAMLYLGIRLPNRSVKDGHWAQTSLLWLILACVVFALANGFQIIRTPPTEKTTLDWTLFLPLFLLIPFSAAYLWLNQNLKIQFKGHEKLSSQQNRVAWNLLIPTLVIFVFVAARPLEQTFVRSLTDKRFAGQEVINFIGLENYRNLLSLRFDVISCRRDDLNQCITRSDGSIRWDIIDREILREGFRTVWYLPLGRQKALALSGLDDDFVTSIGTTLGFTVVSVTLELLLGLFIALTVNLEFAGRGFMRAVMLVPWAMPTVITARLWELMLKDTSAGIVNRLLMDINLIAGPLAWLSTKALQLPAAIMVDVWKTSPFMALLLLAGLQTIPKELYEAASVDGANPLRRFLSITLPLLRPTIAVALVFRTLDSLRVFDLFNVLFGRQQLSMATYNYEILVNNQRDGYASAISIIIFILISLFAIFYIRLLNVETR